MMAGGAHREARRYAILGTGALGGFYGARLQQAGVEVHFLVRGDYEVVRARGLQVDSVEGDFALPVVRAYRDTAEMPPCDVVAIALKATHNAALAQLLPPLLKPGGTVLLLQNGWGIEPELARLAPAQTILGGSCFICSNRVGPGRIAHLSGGAIAVAQYASGYRPAGITPALSAVCDDFARAGITATASDDLSRVRWKKLVWNIPFNGLSVVLDAKTDALVGTPASRALAIALMDEVARGAAAIGSPLPPDTTRTRLDRTERMPPYLTSMKLDYDAGRPLELEAIFGNPLQTATAAGVQLPRVEMLYRQLQFLERQRGR